MKRHVNAALLALMLCGGLLGLFAAIAAPADDGQNAGMRTWVLNSGRLFVAVTPSDTTDLAPAPTRWIITGGAAGCTLAVRGADNGTTAVTITLNPGVQYAFQVKRILATGTTCTGIVAVY